MFERTSSPATPHGVAAFPTASARVSRILAEMTLDEKAAQLVGYWLDQGGDVVAPMQNEMATAGASRTLSEITRHGIGHYTRVYGTRPVDPAERAAWLWDEQRRLQRETRLGIPAIVHEECLTGLAAWKAAAFPTPLAWGASFDPELVAEMGALIGRSMRELGIHQGLAPVLDVVRDPRWGRVDECIGEDPYLVGTIGTAYVQGLQSQGVHATLKHFLGYSGSRAGRNHAPVSAGPREVADVFLPPFEMAIRDGGARSVMNSYSEIDGVPVAADPTLLTDLLRDELGFDGVVVADYFAVAFLEVMHAVARDRGEAAELALTAGIDVELPSGDAYLAPLVERVRTGQLDEAYLDRAVIRVLAQKEELGLLDPDAFQGAPPAVVDLDTAEHRAAALRLAAESIVVLANDGVLPIADRAARIALIGPNADRSAALQGCYSFANHVLAHHPDHEVGFEIPTVREALAVAMPDAEIVHLSGCDVEGDDRSGFDDAALAAADADLAVVVVGDQAGLFGRGTVGEGNDVQSLDLPGVQRELVERIVETGTPVIMVLLTGRPYAIAWALEGVVRPAAVLQSFFPGEAGGTALARVLTGEVTPSGRMPVSLPRFSGVQPYSYLHPILGGPSEVTATDPTPLRPFGFGLSYTSFAYTDLEVPAEASTGGRFTASVTVTNTGELPGDEVVQLYGRDVVATVTRPVAQLLGYARVALEPGESRRVSFDVPAGRFAFTDRALTRVVEPGEVLVWAAAHAAASAPTADLAGTTGGAISNERTREQVVLPGAATAPRSMVLTGDVHRVSGADGRVVTVEVSPSVRA
ncbi:glycoside hydrolase family 3 C-terminal domain-containing protein [Microbacterium sp. Re1]|uniref:Glycoside hydrolase family 3 C-terminal domain-containing protein n=1 Tax=Microbacterium commune TaxID=2762219 RepID=A0ABR8W5L5_9MICO|nr:glycoside hydrolase family 3 N-terminal domain-containing protein [Microbacterium commune]MBD8012101.1 glycoside hydrolase family 3 C-terminal domain-containing protein [Microbacterium commune]